MSTRAVYQFGTDNPTHVYIHHDGYPAGVARKLALWDRQSPESFLQANVWSRFPDGTPRWMHIIEDDLAECLREAEYRYLIADGVITCWAGRWDDPWTWQWALPIDDAITRDWDREGPPDEEGYPTTWEPGDPLPPPRGLSVEDVAAEARAMLERSKAGAARAY